VSSVAITFCVASQRVFIVVYFVIDSVRKLLDTPSYVCVCVCVFVFVHVCMRMLENKNRAAVLVGESEENNPQPCKLAEI